MVEPSEEQPQPVRQASERKKRIHAPCIIDAVIITEPASVLHAANDVGSIDSSRADRPLVVRGAVSAVRTTHGVRRWRRATSSQRRPSPYRLAAIASPRLSSGRRRRPTVAIQRRRPVSARPQPCNALETVLASF
jgi:hypothetical protein